MYEGDRSRKTVLVDYGFRLPSALDNRPLNFDEFMKMTNQVIYVSATPAEFEIQNSVVGNKNYFPHKRQRIGEDELVPFVLPGENVAHASRLRSKKNASGTLALLSRTDEPPEKFDVHTPGAPLVVEQIIRPTGLLDPRITLKPLKNQIDDTIELCRQRVEKNERVLVTTLTKRTAEDLADYLRDVGLKVRYLHSDIDTIERVEILRGLRAADFDILVGINLLREGLDLPEVSLVCILDADKEGFLRSEGSLIQTIGRAARNVSGQVIMYADQVTDSMQRAISETNRRRQKQLRHNAEHGIDAQSIRKKVSDILQASGLAAEAPTPYKTGRKKRASRDLTGIPKDELPRLILALEDEMHEAAKELRFEYAARLRDEINDLKRELKVVS